MHMYTNTHTDTHTHTHTEKYHNESCCKKVERYNVVKSTHITMNNFVSILNCCFNYHKTKNFIISLILFSIFFFIECNDPRHVHSLIASTHYKKWYTDKMNLLISICSFDNFK